MPRDDETRDYLPEAASDPHLPALAPDRAENACQPELHDLRAEEGRVSASLADCRVVWNSCWKSIMRFDGYRAPKEPDVQPTPEQPIKKLRFHDIVKQERASLRSA